MTSGDLNVVARDRAGAHMEASGTERRKAACEIVLLVSALLLACSLPGTQTGPSKSHSSLDTSGVLQRPGHIAGGQVELMFLSDALWLCILG